MEEEEVEETWDGGGAPSESKGCEGSKTELCSQKGVVSHGGGQAAGAMRSQVRATGLGNVATSVALTGDVLREGWGRCLAEQVQK